MGSVSWKREGDEGGRDLAGKEGNGELGISKGREFWGRRCKQHSGNYNHGVGYFKPCNWYVGYFIPSLQNEDNLHCSEL